MRAWKHFVVPAGGSISGFKGGTDASRSAQNPLGQRAGISPTLLHSGHMRPLMHSQEHFAAAGAMSPTIAQTLRTAAAIFIVAPSPGRTKKVSRG
jgi:hypothetical protein